MATILKVGYAEFLVQNPKLAVKAIEALAGAIKLESRYRKGRMCYWPKTDRDHEVSLMTVCDKQLFNSDPGEEPEKEEQIVTPPPRKIRQLNAPPNS
ncbi:MAG: hypothetical protein H7Y43_00940 [Akkermansiaceae bacterium]|nr:hypothetical protein [Verrucomicrobiales bacterium]